jgi:hypothetical protein
VRSVATILVCLLVLPSLTAAADDGDTSDAHEGQGNRIVLLVPERNIAFPAASDPGSTGWTELFPSGARDLLAGFPGNVAVQVTSEGALMRLPSFDGVVEPHSEGEQWSTGSDSLAFVTDRDRANEILGALQLDLEHGSGVCARVTIQVTQHGRGNVKGAVEATVEGCAAGAILAVTDGIEAVFGTVPFGGHATPHPGFTLDTATPDVCSTEAVVAPNGDGVMEPFTALLRLTGVGGDCVVRLRYLDDAGSSFGPQQTVTVAVGGLSVTALDDGPAGASVTVGQVVPEALVPGVKVVDPRGDAVPGVAVTFAVTSGGGSVSPGPVVTDADGVAVAGDWTLGTTAGLNTLVATVQGHAPITFALLGTSAAPARVEVVRGADQVALAGTAVPVPPAVRVTDEYGNPVAGTEVVFSVAAGGGTIPSAVAMTDGEGVAASGTWTLGIHPGLNGLTATVAIDGPVTPGATIAASGTDNLVINALRDRTLADAFVTVRGHALSASRATLDISTTSSSSDVCAVRAGSLRIEEAGLLVPFSVVLELRGAAGRCVVEMVYREAVAAPDGASTAVRRAAFSVEPEATEVLPPPAPSSEPVAVDGIELDERSTVGYSLTEDPSRDGRANVSAWVQSHAGDTGEGSGAGDEDERIELLDRVDVWVAAPLAPAGDALLLEGDEQLDVDGEGFEPGSAVAFYLFSEPTFVGTATVDEDGAFVGSFIVPAHLERDARHTLRLVGFSRLGNAWTVAAPVWLASAAPVVPPVGSGVDPAVPPEEPDPVADPVAPPVESGVDPGLPSEGPTAEPDTGAHDADDAETFAPEEWSEPGEPVEPRRDAVLVRVAPAAMAVPSMLDARAAGAAAAQAPDVSGDAGLRRGESPNTDPIALRSLLRDYDVVAGCSQEAAAPATPPTGWPRVGSAGQVLAVTSVSLPRLMSGMSWLSRSGCSSTLLTSAGSLGLAVLLVAVILLLAWRRRDGAWEDTAQRAAAGTS